ncbi:MAG: rRNA maturation RNase YbeY [Gammaproteobacteria bacterium]|nr:rRNA maturation RNase YbeY [Gammaproteobacteria bacterium]
MTRVDLTVQYASRSRAVPAETALRRWVSAALGGGRRAALTVRIVDRAESRRLNSRWRGRRKPTNVLSFPFGDRGVPGARGHIGDIVVCAPVVNAEASAQGKSREQHWAHILVHGTLHLLGHDHDVGARAARMEALERRLLARMGYPDPYQSGTSA